MEGKDLKRRLVQSTLFPHKDSTTKADESGGGDREEEKVAQEEEDEDWRGSSKKRRVTQKKGNSKLKGKQGASLKEAATLAPGAAWRKLLEYEVEVAYGVEVEVENNPYDPNLMGLHGLFVA